MTEFEIYNQNKKVPKYSPFWIIVIYVLMTVMTALIGSGIMVLAGLAKGLNINGIMSILQNGGITEDIGLLQMIIGINQLSMFIVPALITFLMVDRLGWLHTYKLSIRPNIIVIVLGILTIICSLGLVGYSNELNKLVHLPDWMKSMNSNAEALINALISKNNPIHFIINLILIGIIPGVGEELVFRGIIQTNLYKIFKNPHIAIWVAAIIFSALHLQFDGFLPRMFLGAILGYLYYCSKNLWVSMAAHAANNSLALIFYTFFKDSKIKFDPEDSSNATWYMALISIVLVGTLLFYVRKLRINEELKN
jgi:uncharacterized protein